MSETELVAKVEEYAELIHTHGIDSGEAISFRLRYSDNEELQRHLARTDLLLEVLQHLFAS